MKKIFTFFVCLMLLTVITGCGGDISGTSQTNSKAPEVKKTLVMATNAEFEPFEYLESGEVVGFDVDIANYIAQELGMTLKIDNMGFDAVLAAVPSGKADVGIAALSVKPERLEAMDFSDPYFTAYQAIIVKSDNTSITEGKDLAGKKIGVQLGTTGDTLVSETYESKGAKISRYNKGSEAVLDLVNGKIDAVVIDNSPAKKLSQANPGTKVLEEALSEVEEYAIAVKKGNVELLDKINAALAKMKSSGKYDEIYEKYKDDFLTAE